MPAAWQQKLQQPQMGGAVPLQIQLPAMCLLVQGGGRASSRPGSTAKCTEMPCFVPCYTCAGHHEAEFGMSWCAGGFEYLLVIYQRQQVQMLEQ
jgi:hypothetical protein